MRHWTPPYRATGTTRRSTKSCRTYSSLKLLIFQLSSNTFDLVGQLVFLSCNCTMTSLRITTNQPKRATEIMQTHRESKALLIPELQDLLQKFSSRREDPRWQNKWRQFRQRLWEQKERRRSLYILLLSSAHIVPSSLSRNNNNNNNKRFFKYQGLWVIQPV